jgi:hypothetical protein
MLKLNNLLVSGFFSALLILAGNSPIFAQVSVNGTPGNANDLKICSVTYQIGAEFYTQNNSGDAITLTGFTNPGTDPVDIYKITYDPDNDACDNTLDVFPRSNDVDVVDFNNLIDVSLTPTATNVQVIRNSNITPYKTGSTFNPVYRTEMENVVSVPDLRSYWTVDGPALDTAPDEPGGGGYKFFFSFNFVDQNNDPVIIEDSELILVTERWGNSNIGSHALDINGNRIGDQVRIDGGTGTDDLYSWDTTVLHTENTGQSQWLILFNASTYNTNADIYGLDIDLSSTYADGSILGFRNPGTLLLEGECFRMLSSSPFQNIRYSDILSSIWTQGMPNSDHPGSSDPNVFLWDKTTSGNSASDWAPVPDLNNTVPTGEGFLVSVFDLDDFNDPSSGGFPKELTVTGTENTGPITPTLNSDDANGWTLLGNPFGAPLDWSEVTANGNTSNITNVAYIYDRNFSGTSTAPTNGNVGGWRATSTSTGGFTYGEIQNGLIAPFQGFFVQNFNSTSATIEMQEDDRSSLTFEAGTSNEWEFYGKEKGTPDNYLRFTVEGEETFNTAWLVFSENGAPVKIKGDALELIPFTEDYVLLGTKKGEDILDIAMFPDSENSDIPLHVESTQSGTFTLSATDVNINFAGPLYLTDMLEEKSMLITPDFNYTFSINRASKRLTTPLKCGMTGSEIANAFKPQKAKSSAFGDRFLISTQPKEFSSELPSELALKQNFPNPFNPTTQITYQLPRQSDVRLEVFDMNGRQVATLVNQSVSAGTHTVNFDASDLSSGIYMYRLQAGTTVLTRKLTLIK